MPEKTRITLRLAEDVWQTYDSLCKTIGLRRDTFINLALPRYIEWFKKFRPGTFDRRLVAYRMRDPARTTEVKLRLDTRLSQHVTNLCRQKKYPRDLFFEVVIRELTDIVDMEILNAMEKPAKNETTWNPFEDRHEQLEVQAQEDS